MEKMENITQSKEDGDVTLDSLSKTQQSHFATADLESAIENLRRFNDRSSANANNGPEPGSSISKGGQARLEAQRLKDQETHRILADGLETPNDTFLRLFDSALQIPMAKLGCDLGIFKALAESKEPLSLEQLAASTGADPVLLSRILRYLAAARFIRETDEMLLTYNNVTKALADELIKDGITYIHDITGPVTQVMPAYLKEIKYQESNVGTNLAWHKAFDTTLDFFPFISQDAEKFACFQSLMAMPRKGDWLDVTPITEASTSLVGERVYFVDVGGSIGHQSARLMDKNPALRGRIIVQDTPDVVNAAQPIEGVEFMAHDFFTPQPVKGAKFYYMRTIIHDWSDEKAIEILKNLASALEPDSRILIDDMLLPNSKVHWFPAGLDIHMLTLLGARERNVEQITSLLDRAGLKVVDIKTYMPTYRFSLVTAALK